MEQDTGLPFSFAKRHGVVVTAVAEDRATVTHRPGISHRILAELRRVLKVPVTLVPVTEERFDEALTAVYEQQSNQTMEMAEGLGMPALARTRQLLLKGLGEVRLAPAPLQAAEMVLIRLAYASELPSPAELVKRLQDGKSDGEEAEVDRLEGVPPTVALEQKLSRGTPLSTVGTTSEVYHHLRLLWARLGEVHCPRCGLPGQVVDAASLAARVAEDFPSGDLDVLAPLVRRRKGFHLDAIAAAARRGVAEVRIDGRRYDAAKPPRVDRFQIHDVDA